MDQYKYSVQYTKPSDPDEAFASTDSKEYGNRKNGLFEAENDVLAMKHFHNEVLPLLDQKAKQQGFTERSTELWRVSSTCVIPWIKDAI